MTVKSTLIQALTSAPMNRLMGGLRNQCLPVFMLHRMQDKPLGVSGHNPDTLRAALAYVRQQNYHPISLRTLIEHLREGTPLPTRAVAFTMDDGFYDQAEIAIPIFQEFQVPVTVFIATGLPDNEWWSWDYKLEYLIMSRMKGGQKLHIGSQAWQLENTNKNTRRACLRSVRSFIKGQDGTGHDDYVDDISQQLGCDLPPLPPPAYRAISWSQARALESQGVEFGPHSHRHNILQAQSLTDAEREIRHSWSRLKAELKHPLPVFCYPTGRTGVDFGPREMAIAQHIGLRAAFSADAGYIDLGPDAKNNLFALRRFAFPEKLNDFRQYCSWLERFKEQRYVF
ncbi:polysaccharide deacetylase family protein [Saccharospirillum impatiens]|uniref:polysaccharide deacetylase family protein n=1 Tax=Saccharospirillum impatiens TaxID=169438 RepID=UPI0003FF7E3C|nr:polysaccharide deacetylase family protein [Saccharospirillum impatiens]